MDKRTQKLSCQVVAHENRFIKTCTERSRSTLVFGTVLLLSRVQVATIYGFLTFLRYAVDIVGNAQCSC